MYCTVDDLRAYLSIESSDDNPLLISAINAAQARIDDFTKRTFEAQTDTLRYFDAIEDVRGNELCLYSDISSITTVAIDGSTVPATEYITDPRNEAPYQAIKMRSTSTYTWGYTTAPEDAITVTGRWAYMTRLPFTAIARASNAVTATMTSAAGIYAGQTVHVVGVADTAFNGSFTVTSVNGQNVIWRQSAVNDTDTSGALLIVPPAIRQACIRLAAWLYRQKDTQQGDADRPILAGDGNIIMPSTLPNDVANILREYWKKR